MGCSNQYIIVMVKHLLCIKGQDKATLENFIKMGGLSLQAGGWKPTSTNPNVYEKGGVRLCVVTDVKSNKDSSILSTIKNGQYDYVVYPIVYRFRLAPGVRKALCEVSSVHSELLYVSGSMVTLDRCHPHANFDLWNFFS